VVDAVVERGEVGIEPTTMVDLSEGEPEILRVRPATRHASIRGHDHTAVPCGQLVIRRPGRYAAAANAGCSRTIRGALISAS
jgi:hypothetical protein